MSDGQGDAQTQIDNGQRIEPKIDPRLITDEMAWRGKEIEVRLNESCTWERRIFHTTAKDCAYCFGDSDTYRLFSWQHARPIEQKWRVPTDDDAKKRPKCRVRDNLGSSWRQGYTLLAVLTCDDFSFVSADQEGDGEFSRFCQIEDEA